ncbi:lysophospholipid acyltransferase family protein [Chromatocurvus halotolerans]|uniref:Acyltransferase-like protein n=1 Tax=Chromatocurvus halotolerans TaxID=1132028 RepID=A0A4R2L0B1_9GAMM|nr:lysophospholipid acyltransferase family protein [Chromatocurvus halotolerans]TCO78617.1 acyltransferase-like protein [Chromatocurvus halotolerans]
MIFIRVLPAVIKTTQRCYIIFGDANGDLAMQSINARPTISYVQPGERSARARAIDMIERISGRLAVESIYHRLKGEDFNPSTFFARALELADIKYQLHGVCPTALPKSGPLVLIANHPFGVVDGLMLCDIASRMRGDFRILINALLCRDADLDRFFLPVDFRDNREAKQINIQTKQTALKTLAGGGVILVFPSGGISTRQHGGFGALADFPWTTFTAKLIAKSQATVMPLFFHGTNSRLFHIVSGVSDSLRASLLLHEVRNKMGGRFDVTLGAPVTYESIAHLDRRNLTEHLHALTWSLAEGH